MSTEDHINAKECAQQSAEKCSQRWPKRMTTPQPSMCGEDMTSTLDEQTSVVTEKFVKDMRQMRILLNGVIGRDCDLTDDKLLIEFYNHFKDCPLSSLLNSIAINNNFVNKDNIVSNNAITINDKMDETREYSRDSFSRFGDDLCGDLLRYVSLKDCFEFKYVSKGLKRTVFRGQKKLDTKYQRLLNFKLKKCLFITDITIYDDYFINDRTIDIIRKYCSHLTSVTIKHNSSTETYISSINVAKRWQLFGEKLGLNLRSVSIYKYIGVKKLQTLLKLTKNLIECKRIPLNHFIFETHERQHVLPKLKKISAYYDEIIDFQSFADIYCYRVETIILWKEYKDFTRMREMFEQLSRFRYLEVLHIDSKALHDYNDIDIAFDSIAKNCEKLRSLSLHSDSSIFRRIRHRFASLRRLLLTRNFDSDSVICLNVNDLRCCPNLTHLTLPFGMFRVHCKYFADIHLHLPKLQCFELYCKDSVIDKLLESLALLKELYDIKMNVWTKSVTDTELRNFIKVCKSLRKIDFNSVSRLSRQTIDEFVSHAKSASKYHNYCLRVNVLNGDESVGDKYMKSLTNDLPKNVNIEITAKLDNELVDESDGESDEENDDYLL